MNCVVLFLWVACEGKGEGDEASVVNWGNDCDCGCDCDRGGREDEEVAFFSPSSTLSVPPLPSLRRRTLNNAATILIHPTSPSPSSLLNFGGRDGDSLSRVAREEPRKRACGIYVRSLVISEEEGGDGDVRL
jgi:hypothetical protein